MFYLVYEGQIAGTTDFPEFLPGGFTAIEAEAYPIDSVYFDSETEEILRKPEPPSPEAYWLVDRWELPPVYEAPPEPPKLTDDNFLATARSFVRDHIDDDQRSVILVLMSLCLAAYSEIKGDSTALNQAKDQIHAVINNSNPTTPDPSTNPDRTGSTL